MEFRAMRRIKQELDRDSASEIFKRGASGVLAVAGDDGYPYAVPLSYAYDEGKGRLIFHSATKGHKVDALLREPKASFCVIGQDDVRPEEFTTYFRSVIAFGHVRMLEADDEKREAARLLSRRHAPDMPLEAETAEIERFWKALLMFELRIEHLTGKEAIELVHERKNRWQRYRPKQPGAPLPAVSISETSPQSYRPKRKIPNANRKGMLIA